MQEADRPRRLRAILLAGLGAFLVWQIVTRSLAAYLAHEAPITALILRPNEPTALIALADAALNPRNEGARGEPGLDDKTLDAERDADRISAWAEIALKAVAARLPLGSGAEAQSAAHASLTEEERAAVRARTEAVLAQEPLNARALRILGQLADAAGDKARAAKLMQAAADHSHAESIAVYWMLQQTLADKEYDRALSYADVLLRKRPQLMPHVVPVLGQVAESEDKGAVAAMEATLASNPPWRELFFANLPGGITDARTPLNLLLSLKSSAAPPTTQELSAYLEFLIKRKLFELAYYTWLQFLPADELGRIGYIANASFEAAPSGLPFDWVIQQGAGATIDIAPLPG
jgi:hypothetical protein